MQTVFKDQNAELEKVKEGSTKMGAMPTGHIVK